MGQQHRRNIGIVLNQITLGNFQFRPEGFLRFVNFTCWWPKSSSNESALRGILTVFGADFTLRCSARLKSAG